MPCTHDLAERETMCVDGYCPACLKAELEAIKAEHALAIKFGWRPDAMAREIHSLTTRVQDLERLLQKTRDITTRRVAAALGGAFSISEHTCSVCNEPQFHTTSGLVCKNGHGGAPSK